MYVALYYTYQQQNFTVNETEIKTKFQIASRHSLLKRQLIFRTI